MTLHCHTFSTIRQVQYFQVIPLCTLINIMGRLRRSRTHHAQRDVHRASRTRVSTCHFLLLKPPFLNHSFFYSSLGPDKRLGSNPTHRPWSQSKYRESEYYPYYTRSWNISLESCCIGSTTTWLRETRSRTALLRRMCQVSSTFRWDKSLSKSLLTIHIDITRLTPPFDRIGKAKFINGGVKPSKNPLIRSRRRNELQG